MRKLIQTPNDTSLWRFPKLILGGVCFEPPYRGMYIAKSVYFTHKFVHVQSLYFFTEKNT